MSVSSISANLFADIELELSNSFRELKIDLKALQVTIAKVDRERTLPQDAGEVKF